MDDEERLAAVGATAVTVAVCRAEEGRRPSPWFVDPLAEHVARIAEPAREMTARPGLVFWVALRTRFLDELVTDAVTTQGIRQVVLLGAGLDARAFRLDLPHGSTVFEIDRASVLELKHRLIGELGLLAACERRTVAADVIDDDWPALLAEQGWSSSEATCWIAEGLLVYLDPVARDAFVAKVAKIAGVGGRLGTTLTSSERAAQVELFRSGVDGRPEEWLRELGWQATITRLGDVAERYGRPVSAKAATSSAALLVDAHT